MPINIINDASGGLSVVDSLWLRVMRPINRYFMLTSVHTKVILDTTKQNTKKHKKVNTEFDLDKNIKCDTTVLIYNKCALCDTTVLKSVLCERLLISVLCDTTVLNNKCALCDITVLIISMLCDTTVDNKCALCDMTVLTISVLCVIRLC